MFERVYERVGLYAGRALSFRLSDLKAEAGQGVVEYGMAVAFVALALGAILFTLSSSISSFITSVGSDIKAIPDTF